MSRRPPWVLTSRACAVSTTMRPVASCHLACTGTMTGKRLPRRWSIFVVDGGLTSSSMRVPLQEAYRQFHFGTALRCVYVRDLLTLRWTSEPAQLTDLIPA